jgi:hypothetical protein
MDAGDAIKGMLGGKVMTRAAWEGKLILMIGVLAHAGKRRHLVQASPHGRKSPYQLNDDDLTATDWEAVG